MKLTFDTKEEATQAAKAVGWPYVISTRSGRFRIIKNTTKFPENIVADLWTHDKAAKLMMEFDTL